MKKIARLLVLAGTLVVAACASTTGQVNSTVSGWNLTDVSVRFGPNIERTADGNTYQQNFVWNGLEDGNRKKQVIALFKNAMAEMSETAMTGPQDVKMSVQVNYFHALTNYSRIWCCGEHRIYADLAVTDAASGNVLMQGENVYLGRLALGGVPGLIANAAGRDQYVRVKEGIVKRTREWLAGER